MNILKGNFLEIDFDIKFDIVVGNPPYQEARVNLNNAQTKDLYPSFIDKSVEISDRTLMIVPSRWFIKASLKNFRENMLNSYGLKNIIHTDNNLLFDNADIKGGVCYFLLENGYEGATKFNGTEVNLTKYDIIPNLLTNTTFNIIDKIGGGNNIDDYFKSQGFFKVKTNDIRLDDNTDNTKCYVSKQKGSIKYINEVDDHLGTYKVIIPAASGKGGIKEEFYNRVFIGLPGEICSESFIFFDFETENEANNFKTYLESSLFSFMVRLRKIKQHVTKDIFKWVPKVPLDREWTDEQLYDYFNLTDEEIKLIEETVK